MAPAIDEKTSKAQGSEHTLYDLKLWLALSQMAGLGNAGICQLLTKFGSPDAILAPALSNYVKLLMKKSPEKLTKG